MESDRKSNFKKYIVAIIPVLSFIAVAFGSTYAMYLATVVGNEDNGDLTLQSVAQVFTMFEATDTIDDDAILPGYSNEMHFTISNTTSEANVYANYSLYWEIINKDNEIDDENFVYTLTGTSVKNGVAVADSDTNKVINVTNPIRIPNVTSKIGDVGVINSGITHQYTLKISFLETGENQNDLQSKKFTGKIVAKGE